MVCWWSNGDMETKKCLIWRQVTVVEIESVKFDVSGALCCRFEALR